MLPYIAARRLSRVATVSRRYGRVDEHTSLLNRNLIWGTIVNKSDVSTLHRMLYDPCARLSRQHRVAA